MNLYSSIFSGQAIFILANQAKIPNQLCKNCNKTACAVTNYGYQETATPNANCEPDDSQYEGQQLKQKTNFLLLENI